MSGRKGLLPLGLPPERRLAVAALSGGLTLAAVFVVLMLIGLWSFFGAGPEAKGGGKTSVVLRPGAGVSEIGGALDRANVVRSGALFTLAAQLTGAGRSLKAGEYEFDSRASMAQVIDAIRDGRVVRRTVTIPEGATSEMVVEILMANPVLTGDVPIPEEGSILPETYEVRRGEDRAAVLKRMTDAQEALLTQLWAQRQQDLPFSSPREAVIMASIVEKETGKAAERPRIAGLFINRLRTGMRLDSDPTIIYGVTRGRPLGRGILLSEKNAVTPYNTYQIDGLPAGPICNPGREALAAVLDPAKTDEVYFVADGTGGHVFAKTLDEHNRNVARWRVIEQQQAAAAAAALPKGK